MVLFAGPIVIEWYWIPLALVMVLGPPALLVAVVSEVVLRMRRSATPTWARRRRMWAIVAAGVMMLALLMQTVGSRLLDDREANATARTFTFIPYEPRSLPAPFTVESVTASDTVGPPTLVSQYEIGPNALATAYQQEPVGRLSAENGRCALTQLGGDGLGDRPPEFPCRELRTPAGIRVFFNDSPGQVPRRMAFAVLDGTLVRLTFEPLPEHAVLAYFDSLRPVDRDDIKFKR